MEDKQIQLRVKALVQDLVELGYLDARNATSSRDFHLQFQRALEEVLADPNPRLHKKPTNERFEWLEVRASHLIQSLKTSFNFRYVFFPETGKLELGEQEVFILGKFMGTYLATDDNLLRAEESFARAGGEKLSTRRTPFPKVVDPPGSRKNRKP